MSPENVEIARRGIEAVNRKPEPDWATINEVYHADHEFISALDALEAEKHRGARGYRDWLLNTKTQSRPSRGLHRSPKSTRTGFWR